MLPQGVVIPSKEHFCERVNFVLSTGADKHFAYTVPFMLGAV